MEAWFNDHIEAAFSNTSPVIPDEANALLNEAGLADVNGDGRGGLPDDAPVVFEIQVDNRWTDRVQVANRTTKTVADLGITANAHPVDWSPYNAALKQGSHRAVMSRPRAIQTDDDDFHPDRVGQSLHACQGMATRGLGALIDDYGQGSPPPHPGLDDGRCGRGQALHIAFSNPIYFHFDASPMDGCPTAEDGDVQLIFHSVSRTLVMFERLHQK